MTTTAKLPSRMHAITRQFIAHAPKVAFTGQILHVDGGASIMDTVFPLDIQRGPCIASMLQEPPAVKPAGALSQGFGHRRVVQLFLELDRPTTLEQLRRVLHGFAMPAVHLLADSDQREARTRALNLFDEQTYLVEVYQPILAILGVQRRELGRWSPARK